MGGHDSVVCIATRYGVDRPGIAPEGARLRVAQTGADAHPAIRTMVTVSFLEVIWPERIAHLPSHSGARFRMGWSYTPTSPPCLYSRVMG
jgi:hypothetical protein